MIKIVTKFVDELKEQVKEKGVRIKIDKEATNWLITKGFDPKMGARPLQRVIDKEIKRPLAKQLLFGDLTNGGWVTISIQDDSIALVSKPRMSKVPLLSVETKDNVTESN